MKLYNGIFLVNNTDTVDLSGLVATNIFTASDADRTQNQWIVNDVLLDQPCTKLNLKRNGLPISIIVISDQTVVLFNNTTKLATDLIAGDKLKHVLFNTGSGNIFRPNPANVKPVDWTITSIDTNANVTAVEIAPVEHSKSVVLDFGIVLH